MAMNVRVVLGLFLFGIGVVSRAGEGAGVDPNLWLEELHSPRVDAWIKNENAKTLAVLEHDNRYADYLRQATEVTTAKDKIPLPEFMAGDVFNFWRDAEHERGEWRRTALKDYRKPHPEWHVILDLDQLARDEKVNWVWKGVDCLLPGALRCMISLSDGGEDAVTAREFDTRSRRFVDHGLLVPHGKQTLAWQDENTLLVAREWQKGELTTSGYPYVVKRLRRGQSLDDAKEVFRGAAADVEAELHDMQDGKGHHAIVIESAHSFFQADFYVVKGDGVERINLPEKAELKAFVSNKLIFSISQNWNDGNARIKAGSLVAFDMDAIIHRNTTAKPTVIYTPSAREAIQGCAATRNSLVVAVLKNVRSQVYVYRQGDHQQWVRNNLPLPDNSSVDIVAADKYGNSAFLQVSGFLQPPTLVLANTDDASIVPVKRLPAKFNAAHLVVEQLGTHSRDGTFIPYFIVHRRGLKLDGSNPAILYGYGGFAINETPEYLPVTGKLWLEKGGVFVLANIRGGGEFGPQWHDAGLKTHRQVVYDDFVAVARDLITRGITSPRRLGIQGGSNGGLLMGVEFTQHPELWNAVDIEIPLLDMLRYETIGAGSSWVGEYGSVSVPQERAFLASISPYANLHKGTKYPEPFIWTTTKDDRVGPQHARKFAARLSEYGIPYLFYESADGGHGAGATLQERAHMSALVMIYFTRKLMD